MSANHAMTYSAQFSAATPTASPRPTPSSSPKAAAVRLMLRSISEYVYVLRASTSAGRSGVWSACRAWIVRTDSPERSASRAIEGAASECTSPNAWMLLATRKTRATRIGVGSNLSRKRMSAPRVNARRTRKDAAVTAEQRSAASSPTSLKTEPIDRSGVRPWPQVLFRRGADRWPRASLRRCRCSDRHPCDPA
jgi:hypothetical protein